jgi:hypothetical protein
LLISLKNFDRPHPGCRAGIRDTPQLPFSPKLEALSNSIAHEKTAAEVIGGHFSNHLSRSSSYILRSLKTSTLRELIKSTAIVIDRTIMPTDVV